MMKGSGGLANGQTKDILAYWRSSPPRTPYAEWRDVLAQGVRVVDHGVFINYRGEDSYSYGALLYTELIRVFGEEHVFLDAESIPAGADFVQELLGRVRSARMLLAVIGPHWLSATDPTDRRRIDDPADWIRRELAEAFRAGVRVIPVLTDQAELPREADLPTDISALSRCQYRHLRRREPTADLGRIVTDLTSLDPTLAAAARSRNNAPRQLPAAPCLFIGRATEFAILTDMATAPDAGMTVVISAIGGAGGIGKTALTLQWAYQHLHRFPDGQLYVNLRGFDPSGRPTPAGEAVYGFLTALGVDPATLPNDMDAQAARYRTLVAGKRMLIVLDNARDIDQVIPLLPGSPTCTVLVTSRHHLAGLTLHGARLLDLDVLSESDAHDLLARQLGAQRLAAEPSAAAELLALCAGLPLALRIVAARAALRPAFPLVVLAEELRDISVRLDGLNAGDLHANLRAVLSWSFYALDHQAASMFGLLGIAPGPDISLPAAASLTGQPVGNIRAVLRELEDASLVQQHVPGRYRMHDLTRLYSAEQASQDPSNEARKMALRRVVDFYLHTAHTADRRLAPFALPVKLGSPVTGCQPQPLADDATALAWFDTEHHCLLATQQIAIAQGWHHVAWHLAWTLSTFHRRRGHLHDDLATWEAGLAVARHLADQTASIVAHRCLGDALARVGRDQEGLEHLQQALALADHVHDRYQQAHTHQTLAMVWNQRGEHRRELRHATHALHIYEDLDDPVRKAIALNLVGRCATRLGDYERAQRHCQAALILHRLHRYPTGEADTADSLGYLNYRTGHHTRALDHYQHALILRRALGNTYAVADTLDSIGHPRLALGHHEQARAVWREALELYQAQARDADTARLQRQLDDLDHLPDMH